MVAILVAFASFDVGDMGDTESANLFWRTECSIPSLWDENPIVDISDGSVAL